MLITGRIDYKTYSPRNLADSNKIITRPQRMLKKLDGLQYPYCMDDFLNNFHDHTIVEFMNLNSVLNWNKKSVATDWLNYECSITIFPPGFQYLALFVFKFNGEQIYYQFTCL